MSSGCRVGAKWGPYADNGGSEAHAAMPRHLIRLISRCGEYIALIAIGSTYTNPSAYKDVFFSIYKDGFDYRGHIWDGRKVLPWLLIVHQICAKKNQVGSCPVLPINAEQFQAALVVDAFELVCLF